MIDQGKKIIVGQTQTHHIAAEMQQHPWFFHGSGWQEPGHCIQYDYKKGLERESSEKSNKIIKGLEGFTCEED